MKQLQFTFLCLLLAKTSSQLRKDCFYSKNGQLWKLAISDEFNGHTVNKSNWFVTHETEKCNGNWIQQESCNHRDNVRQSSGYLHLQAQYQPYANFNYTSATITSHFAFTHGRIEVRATLPRGRQLRTSIFTVTSNESTWHDRGQIVLSTQADELDRRVFFTGSTENGDAAGITQPQAELSGSIHEFHLYGFEWSRGRLQFFFDDIYEKPLWFNRSSHLDAWYKIRLQIGVGYKLFGQPLPANFKDLQWEAPNFLIDYIRIFQPTESAFGLVKCEPEFISQRVEKEDIARFARESMEKMKIPENEKTKLGLFNLNWPLYLGAFMFVFFVFLVIFILYQLKKVKAKVTAETTKLRESRTNEPEGTGYFSTAHSEPIYESVFGVPAGPTGHFYEQQDGGINFEEFFLGQTRSKVVKQNSDTSNEYVPIKPFIRH